MYKFSIKVATFYVITYFLLGIMIYFRFYFFHLISSRLEIIVIVGSNVSGGFLLTSPNMLQEFWPIPPDITLRTESKLLVLLLTDTLFLFHF